jgi:transmembrane sensor
VPSHLVLQQAAHWYARLGAAEADGSTQRAWQQWYTADAMHRQAWATVERISQRMQPLQGDTDGSAQALLLARGNLDRRKALGALGIGSAALLLGATVWRAPLQETLAVWRAGQRTEVGNVRSLALADGSQVWLNSATALNIDYRTDLRLLQLLQGEILIQTAVDARPLVVSTGEGRLRALGTRFSVQAAEGQTQLSVFEGAVQASTDFAAPRVIQAGQQIRFDHQRWGVLTAASPGRQSWTRGVLLADNLRLGDFVEELRRYRHGYLGVAPQIADIKVVGAYPLNNPDLALDMLASALPIRLQRTLPWWVSLEPRQSV